MGLISKLQTEELPECVSYAWKTDSREKLEPRILLDAAALLGADVVLDDPIETQEVEAPVTTNDPASEETDADSSVDVNAPSTIELLIVDEAIADYQEMIADIFPEQTIQDISAEGDYDAVNFDDGRVLHVYTLGAEVSGIGATSDILQAYNHNVSNIHIFSHAVLGNMNLGSDDLSVEAWSDYQIDTESWQDAITSEADVTLYGVSLIGDDATLESTQVLYLPAMEHIMDEVELANLAEVEDTLDKLDYFTVPLGFEANVGQIDDGSVDFFARGSGYQVFLSEGDAILRLGSDQVVRLDLTGTNEGASAFGDDLQGSYSNYLIGNDADAWQTHVDQFGRVVYSDIYDGIDVHYYGMQQQLEYDFVVAAGADYEQISIAFGGTDRGVYFRGGSVSLSVARW